MLADAHCHPFDLAACFPAAEGERRRLGVVCAASATTMEEFEYCEELSRQAGEQAPLLPCFAVHPQLPMSSEQLAMSNGLKVLDVLAGQGRLTAVGETGFDLYNAAFRETEAVQDELFAAHLEAALCYDLPLVIHVRRAMHKIFAHAPALKRCRAVVFHSWPGTAGEGDALLRRGINAFFSFGTTIMLNHREAMRCCAAFPASRLLAETDAPFQPLRGREFSSYADLVAVLETMASLRREAGSEGLTVAEMENVIERNFRAAFGV
ncbi:MAG: TatD family hydrolase [Treponema sp.]|jgi:TatD DNase family protein|nr:TatD family hydrolase [Treponema sp.]